YDKTMVTGVIQAGSSLGILFPPSVVLVLYAMIARQPVLDLWLAGVGPGFLMAAIFAVYVYLRCLIQPEIGPALPAEERAQITRAEKFTLLREGLMPLAIFAIMMGMFVTGTTSLVESSVVGAVLSMLAAWWAGNMNRRTIETATRNTLGISCMFLWIILAALCFSAV